MKEFQVLLTSINHVKDFVTAASMCSCDIDVTSGRYTIDAKSIMGLFSLDLSRPINIRVLGSDQEAEAFYRAIEEVVCK